MRKMLTLAVLLLALSACKDTTHTIDTDLDDAMEYDRQKLCFDGDFWACECDDPPTDMEARFCEENDLYPEESSDV